MTSRATFSKRARLLLLIAFGGLILLPSASLVAVAAHADATTGVNLPTVSSVTGDTHRLALAPASDTPGSPSMFSTLSPALLKAPWIASLAHRGTALSPLTSLPSFALLQHPARANNGSINPLYVAQPAPLGLADYGLGLHTYSYNVSNIMGQVVFNAPPNVTDPGATNEIETAGGHDGNVGSPYEFGIQLNTVATNISLPGTDQGFFWTQNVLNFNDTAIHWVDDTFNVSSATQNPFVIEPGTIYSACNNGTAGVDTILTVYGGVFQCVGASLPITPASFPITIQLYNNASINAQKRTQVSYGYLIDEAGIGKVYSGISDTVVFNNPTPLVKPANTPGFSVDGFAPSPAGLFRDAEMDLVGSIGGDNSVFRSLSASINLETAATPTGHFHNVPSAYNFGGDTGETSTGIADYWTTSHTEVLNQGPAMLYGLWGAVPGVSVRSGAIHLAGSITPSYGFVFVSNTAPVADPFGTGAQENMSWLPTTNAGTFNTWLPPTGGRWTTAYYVQGLAAGSAEVNGTTVSASTTTYALRLPRAAGSLNAPLYMFGNTQASQLAKNVTGSATPPYDFNGLTVNMNFTFNHLNDYSFPSFELFMAQGVTHPIEVNNTYQGQDSNLGNFYWNDFGAIPFGGLLWPAPLNTTSLPDFTSGIYIFNGDHDSVTNQTLAEAGYNLQLVYWQDRDASASAITSEYLSSGVWIGDSVDTTVWNVQAVAGGDGLTDMSSVGTVATQLTAVSGLYPGFPFDQSLGVEALSSIGLSVSDLSVQFGAIGVSAGVNYGAGAAYDAYYYYPGAFGTTLSNVTAFNGSLGANFSLSERTTVTNVATWNQSTGIILNEAPGTVTQVMAWNGSIGVQVIDNPAATTVSRVISTNASTGVQVLQSTDVKVTHASASISSTAVWVSDSTEVKISYVSALDHSYGAYVVGSTFVVISHVKAHKHSTGVYIVS